MKKLFKHFSVLALLGLFSFGSCNKAESPAPPKAAIVQSKTAEPENLAKTPIPLSPPPYLCGGCVELVMGPNSQGCASGSTYYDHVLKFTFNACWNYPGHDWNQAPSTWYVTFADPTTSPPVYTATQVPGTSQYILEVPEYLSWPANPCITPPNASMRNPQYDALAGLFLGSTCNRRLGSSSCSLRCPTNATVWGDANPYSAFTISCCNP